MNQPTINIEKKESGIILSLATPGLKKEDISIAIEEDRLIISADKKEETATRDAYNYRGFNVQRFKRIFDLKAKFNQEAVDAKYEAGILSIHLKYKEDYKRVVTIQ